MAKKKTASKIVNRRARFDYQIGDELVAGIVLDGRETKSLRTHHGHLKGAFVNIKNNEAWLMNATITSGPGYEIATEDQTKPRKLLLKRREIETLKQAKDEGKTIVPLELQTDKNFIKIKIAIGKGKKLYDKRKDIKRRDIQRETSRKFKH